jgi:uncharacterized protein (TIGR02246 family)
MSDEDQIWDAIVAANQAWLRGEPAAVAALFAPDVVGIHPNLDGAVRGRDAMVQSFVDYVAQVRTHHFDEQERSVEVLGAIAVATYRFEVRYEIAGATRDECGQEVLVLRRGGDGWQVVWRTQVPLS